MLKLFARCKVSCWIKWLHGLLSRHLPSGFRCLELLGVCSRNVCSTWRQRLLKLWYRHLSGIHGCFKLLRVCFRNSIERDRCAGLEHLCALSGGFLLVDFDVLGMRGLRCGEFLGRSGRIELFGLLLGLLRCGYDVYCVFIVHCRQVPK